MGDQNLNNILKKENMFEIIENDIFYREGVLEILEKNNNIDILILYEKLYGEIPIMELINNIKKINDKINIFFILEKENEELENSLKKENVKNIFYINSIDIDNLIIKLKNTKINNYKNLEEEINLLKNLINKKDEELLNYKNNNLYNLNTAKIITVIGETNVGKSLIISNFYSTIKNKKIEIINVNNGNENLDEIIIKKNKYDLIFLEMELENFELINKINKITDKFIFIIEVNCERINLNKKIIDKLISENIINQKKINIIFNKTSKYSINKKIAKNIFKNLKIIGKIKLNNYCSFILNEKNNLKIENIKLKKEYLKIIKNF